MAWQGGAGILVLHIGLTKNGLQLGHRSWAAEARGIGHCHVTGRGDTREGGITLLLLAAPGLLSSHESVPQLPRMNMFVKDIFV